MHGDVLQIWEGVDWLAVSLSPSLAAKYPAPTDCALCTHVLNVCGIDFTEHKESFSNAS